LKKKIENTEVISFYEEQLDAQRGMLSSAIDELVIKNFQLESTLDKLTQRNNEISQISYRTYHDMRGPMVTLLGVLELVRDEVENSTVDNLLDQAVILINRLDQFSNSLSSYTEIIQNEFIKERIDIETFFEKIRQEISIFEGFEKVKIDFEFDNPTKSTFNFDLLRITAIFKIFLTNAIRYRDIDKEICYCKVSVGLKENTLKVKIVDNGMGISDDAKPRIYKMFFRGSILSQGSGLGLYVANNLIKEVNKKLNIESQEGVGTQVFFELPNLQ